MDDPIETLVFRDPWDVDRRLIELGLHKAGLLKAVAVSRTERNNVTPFHPANAAGTFSYHHGVAAIRSEFVGDAWMVDRSDGIEAIWNQASGLKVSFCNVDQACGVDHPRPRSDKGAGAERASGGSLFEHFGLGPQPQFAPRPTGDGALYYLMVDQNGAAELTRPVIKNRTFTAAVERLFLLPGDEPGDVILPLDDGNDIADGFDPQIVRK